MKITVIGLGYVGLVAAACLAELEHEVFCVDSDLSKLEALRHGETPIFEKFLPELLKRHSGQRMRFELSLTDAVRASAAIFIAVGTPPASSGEADLSHVEFVSRQIAHALSKGTYEYKVIIGKSTVPVYTADWVRKAMELNGAPPGKFGVASNPEFLREGTAVTDFLYPDRIVVGSEDQRCIDLLKAIYEPLTSGCYPQQPHAIPAPDGAMVPARLIACDAKSAELIKHASNAFLAMKISYINAVANICEAVGADVDRVREGIGADARIGSRFLHPGIGYGGSCFPKDVTAFRAVAQECGYSFGLLDEVVVINDEQRQRFVRKIRRVLWTLKGKHLAALGLAFKGGTDDIRESPAMSILRMLEAEGCTLSVYDPSAASKAQQSGLLSADVRFADNPYEAARGANAVLILTDWEEFTSLDLPRLRAELRYPIIVDGRNLFSPSEMMKQGFIYVSVGRPQVGIQPAASLPRM